MRWGMSVEGAENGLKAWLDSSNGDGELETNDSNYAYNYLKIPENIKDIYENVTLLRRISYGYATCLDPTLTQNN